MTTQSLVRAADVSSYALIPARSARPEKCTAFRQPKSAPLAAGRESGEDLGGRYRGSCGLDFAPRDENGALCTKTRFRWLSPLGRSRGDTIKKQYFDSSGSRYRAQLDKQGLSDEQVRRDIKAQLISEQVFKKVTSDVRVLNEQARDYYDTHRSLYDQPQSREVRHVLVADEQLARDLYERIRRGEDMAAIARRYTTDPGSRGTGGRLTVSRGQTVPPFDRVTFSLRTGQLSEPVHTQYGWHVIEALSPIRPARTTPFEKVRATIVQQLKQEGKNKLMTAWVNRLVRSFRGGVLYADGYDPATL